jgi:NCAIR mutase (PurE)-related protein
MPRARPIAARKDLKEIAKLHIVELNEMIKLTNEQNRAKASVRLEQFVHEAMGRLEIGELVDEYEQLQARMSEIRRRWLAFMGDDQHIEGYTKSSRPALIQRINGLNKAQPVPAPFMEQVRKVAEKYGVPMREVVPIGQVGIDELVERLARCKTTAEMDMVLAQNMARTLALVGISQQDGNPDTGRSANGAV